MSDAKQADEAIGRLSEAEGDAWDALWDDHEILCVCDGCNHYSPTYDPDRECSLATHIRAIVRTHAERAWDEGWRAAWSPMAMHDRDNGPNPYRDARQEQDR